MRSDPTIEVFCDCCTASEEFTLDLMLDGSWGIDVDDEMESLGWVTVNGKDYCSIECAAASGWDGLVTMCKKAQDDEEGDNN